MASTPIPINAIHIYGNRCACYQYAISLLLLFIPIYRYYSSLLSLSFFFAIYRFIKLNIIDFSQAGSLYFKSKEVMTAIQMGS